MMGFVYAAFNKLYEESGCKETTRAVDWFLYVEANQKKDCA